jgi:conjugative relaxase-like TrwC/TraI family protein
VLNIGQLVGEGSAQYYLDKVARGVEDYYLHAGEAPGMWHGSAALALGLAGEVAADDLMALLHGDHPTNGVRLAQPQRNADRLWGYDLTLRAPKSVSLLFALGEGTVPVQVRSAHEAAVEAALAYLERAAGFGRRRVDGEIRSVRGNGFVAAAFQHRTSRAGDPLLHTHALVANLVRGENGRWGALDGRLLYAHAKAAGVLYQAQLRPELARRLGVAWTPVRHGLADVEGIPAAVLRAFSRRRQEIAVHMAARGETSAKAAQVATLQTRKAKDYGVHPEGLLPEWRQRAASLGFGPEALAATLGRAAAPGLDEEDVAWAIDSLLGPPGLTAHASSFTRRDVVVALGDWLSPASAAADVEQAADRLLADADVVAVSGTNAPARVHTRAGLGGDDAHLLPEPDERRFTTRDLLAIERHLVEGALARRSCGAGRAIPSRIEAALAARPSLSVEQVAMCRRVLSSGDGVEVVRGHAGTGKTYGLDGCRQAWESSGLRVLGCALSARAAAELHAGAGITSSTINRLLFEMGDRDAAHRYLDIDERLAMRREPSLRLDARTVVVVDEAGMVGTRMLAKLLEYVGRAHAKAVVVGDDAQLPEIDAGGAFRGLAARLGVVELTENRRQNAHWERQALRFLREGLAEHALPAYAAHGRVVTGASAEAVRSRMAADWWAAQRADDGDVVMVACRRADVRDLNERARALRVAAGEVRGAELVLPGGAVAVGDHVITKRNDRHLGVRNGSRGAVSAIDPGSGTIDVALDDVQRGRITVRLPRDYLEAGHLTHAYALTAHTAQGMTAGRALILGDESVFREWGYVALSRGRKENRLYVVAGERAAEVREALHGRAALAQPVVRELITSLKRSRAQRLALDEGTPSIEVTPTERQRLRTLSDADLVEELRCASRGRVPASPRPPDLSDIALARAEQEAAETRAHLEAAQARAVDLRARLDSEGRFSRWRHRQQRERNEQALRHEEDRLPKLQKRSRTADAQVTALCTQQQEHARWDAEYARLKSEDHVRGQAIHAELRRRERERVRTTAERLARLEAAPPSYLLAALGERPDGAAEQRKWRRAALELEVHRNDHGVTDLSRPLGDTLRTSAGLALLRRLEGARTLDNERATPLLARREIDSVLAEIRRNDAKRGRWRHEFARHEQQRGLYHHRHHAAHNRASGRGPSLTL